MSGRALPVQQLRLTAAAALATALATAALRPVFAGGSWSWRALGAIAVVAVAGLLTRLAGWSRPWQVLLTLVVLFDYVCLLFVRSSLVLGVLPGARTWAELRRLTDEGFRDIAALTTPVPGNPGLLLVATAGVALIAFVVDLTAVTLGRAVLAGAPLLVLFAVPGAVQGEGVGWFAFAVAAAGWLGLLLVEGQGRAQRWGSSLGDRTRGGDPGVARVGRRIGSAALGIAVVAPLLLPGLESRLPGGSGEGENGGPRTTTTYNPITRLRADLRLPDARPILSYRTDDPRPDYLRLTTLDRFSDGGWTASRLSGTPRRNGVDRGLPEPIGLTDAATRPVRASIDIAGLQARWLPVPFPPTSVQITGPWLYDATSETVFSIRAGTQDLQGTYDVTARRVLPDRDRLAAASTALPPSLRDYLAPPPMTRAVAALTDRIVAGRTSPYDRVSAIQAFFLDRANRFVYDTSPSVPGVSGPSALEDFLVTRRGFCEQYASAMGAMIRRAGVPARVAVGFTPGTRQPDGSYAVTTDNAHAWPEAWFAGAGWVRFEPTPRGDGQTTVPDYARPQGAEPETAPPPTAAASPAAPTAAPSAAPLTEPGANEPRAGAGVDQGGALARRVGTALVGLVLLALLLSVPALVHRLRQRRRWASCDAATASWAQLRDDITDAGLPWADADSPRGAAQRLASSVALSADAGTALDRLVLATERARYAPPSASGEQQSEALRAESAVVRRGLLAVLPWRRRWRARALPASTLGWGVHGAGSAVADLLDGLDNGWAALRGRLRLRRS